MLLVLQKDATPFPGWKCHHLAVPVTGDGGQLIGVRSDRQPAGDCPARHAHRSRAGSAFARGFGYRLMTTVEPGSRPAYETLHRL